MAQLDDILQGLIADRKGVYGCAVVDMDTRRLLGAVLDGVNVSPANLEALAVAAVDMVRGKHVRAVETLLAAQFGNPIANAIDEVCVTAKNTRHFFAVILDKPNFLLVLSTDAITPVGIGWLLVRRNMPLVAAHCP